MAGRHAGLWQHGAPAARHVVRDGALGLGAAARMAPDSALPSLCAPRPAPRHFLDGGRQEISLIYNLNFCHEIFPVGNFSEVCNPLLSNR